MPLASDPEQETCWRHGALLVVRHGAALPTRCVKCNAPAAEGMRDHRFHWAPQRVYLPLLAVPVAAFSIPLVPHDRVAWLVAVIPLAFLATLIASRVLRRTAHHAIGLCESHRRRRARASWRAVALLVAALLSVFLVDTLAPLFVLGGLAVVLGVYGRRVLSPVRIDAEYSRFVECGTDFLASIPLLPEYRNHYLKRRAHRE